MDGRARHCGEQSAKAKLNLQIPQDSAECRELGEFVLRALGRNPTFNSAALPCASIRRSSTATTPACISTPMWTMPSARSPVRGCASARTSPPRSSSPARMNMTAANSSSRTPTAPRASSSPPATWCSTLDQPAQRQPYHARQPLGLVLLVPVHGPRRYEAPSALRIRLLHHRNPQGPARQPPCRPRPDLDLSQPAAPVGRTVRKRAPH